MSDADERGFGDNSDALSQIRSFVERYERLEEEKQTIAQDQKDVMAEAKGGGFDTKVLKALIRERKQDKDALDEFKIMLERYGEAFS